MLSGPMRHRVWIQRPTEVRTDSGAFTEAFEDWLEVWADIEPLSVREALIAQGIVSDITTRIRMRWRDAITAKMRIRHQVVSGSPSSSDYYDIEGPPMNVNGRRVEMWLMCKRRDAEGFRTGEHGDN